MHDFLAAIVPEPYRVLGENLRPLSFGHVVLLARLDLDPVQTDQDLALAVAICSRTFEDGQQFVSEIMTPAGQRKLEQLVKNTHAANLGRAFEAWFDYLDSHSSHPEPCQVDGPESDRGAPFLAQVRAWLLGHCNYSPEYLMDAPWGQCLWDYGSSIEETQGYGIVGDRHREIAQILKNAMN